MTRATFPLTTEQRLFLDQMAAAGTPLCETCWGSLVNGICRSCAWVTPIEYANAHGRAEEGVDWGTPQWALDQKIIALYERIEAHVERDATITPNGCQSCGTGEREHEQRWTYMFQGVRRPFHDWHAWQTPADRQRLGRMYARRYRGWQAWREINRRFYLRLPAITA